MHYMTVASLEMSDEPKKLPKNSRKLYEISEKLYVEC